MPGFGRRPIIFDSRTEYLLKVRERHAGSEYWIPCKTSSMSCRYVRPCDSCNTVLLTTIRKPRELHLTITKRVLSIDDLTTLTRQLLKSPTAPTALPPGRIARDRGNVLDTSDPHACTGKRSEGGLTTWTRLLGGRTAGGAELDVECSDADFFAFRGDILRGQHRGVRLRGCISRRSPWMG